LSFEVDWIDCLRLLAAAFLGALIGIEREIHGRPAGFRTHLLVASGSALIMLVALHMCDLLTQRFSAGGPVRADPLGLAGGAVTGIGFLGAGVILKTDDKIRGLTTAASIWVVSAVGLAVGAGWYVVALTTTGLALFALWVLAKLETHFAVDRFYQLTVTYPLDNANLSQIEQVTQARGLLVQETSMELDRQAQRITYRLRVRARQQAPEQSFDLLARELADAVLIRWE